MHFLSAASILLLFTTDVLALPKPRSAVSKRSIRVQAKRYIPERSIIIRDNGNVSAQNDGGGWLLPVLVGGQQMILNIDTGSADLWVASTNLPADEQAQVQTGFPLYDQTKSTTYQPFDGENFSLAYGDGSSASGPAAREQVDIGGAIVPNMPIGVANSLQLGQGQTSRNSDGPVGLAFKYGNSIRPDQQGTFMEFLEPYVDQPVFSTTFRTDDSGFVVFGTQEPGLYTGDLTQVPVANQTDGSWTVSGVSFGSNGQTFSSAPIDVLFDTGGAGLDIPSDALAAYFATVPGSSNNGGTYSYPCGTTLPDFDFIFSRVSSGPATVTIPGAALKNGDGTTGDCFTWMGEASGRGSGGLPFFISQYIVWHQADPSMAFARQA